MGVNYRLFEKKVFKVFLSETQQSAVLGGEGEGLGVFMEKVYRCSKWWEVKDWVESVSELMTV